ncbi:vacuolar-sorting receptor 6-like [Nymphaea colorata]|nr:vacuolar-sorting receptor 6-like [Nymphaea colorata]
MAGRPLPAFFLPLLVLVLSTASVTSRFVVEKSSISVVAPDHLRGKHDGAIANFGVPHYGARFSGILFYPSTYSSSNMGCDPFTSPFKPPASSSNRPLIVLIDRGGCLFALKVWNAQQAGAKAVLVADDRDEPLITMDAPNEETEAQAYVEKIDIPSAMIEHSLGEELKQALAKGEDVVIQMDWSGSMPNPDSRVEYELWTNSNDECGIRCDEQMEFVKNFRGHAQLMEKGGFTLFTPHYITWYCPPAYITSSQCKSQCINNGRYCAPDPEMDFDRGYEGKDVLLENLRQLCVHRVANESNRAWVWWDYVTDFHIRCRMREKKYNQECAEQVIAALNLPVDKIQKCMGDPNADAQNPVLEMEQKLQVGQGSRGDVTILPTLVINNVQYRGKLERTAILEAICAGFQESTEPQICLTQDIETNECLENYGGCWHDTKTNISACKDTFRGRVCQCPSVNGVQYQGDGYTNCEAVGPGRCAVNNGGCWSETRNAQTFSACSGSELAGCKCPQGFIGDGHTCDDIDECKEHLACKCDGCRCKNKWGGYDCSCGGGLVYIKEQDTCIARSASRFGWFILLLVLSGFVGISVAGYVFYKYRLRSYMDGEIMAIMSQYMPLDNHNNEAEPLRETSV